MRPKLTIAIPTYNRAKQLEECIKRVISYKGENEIEILISDNASSDDTQDIVHELKKLHPEILYYRNPQNLGFDGNFLNCFEHANGEYIWLLSDDDIILPGAIESVLTGCEKKPVCMHLNSTNVISEDPLLFGEPRFNEEGFIEYFDKNLFIEKIGIFCTFLSSLVYNLDLVKQVEDKERYFNTNILQSHVFFEIMRNNGLYILNTFNCLAARSNKKVSYDVLRTWVKNYSDLMITTADRCGFDTNRMKKILRKDLNNTIYEFVLKFRQTCDNEKNWDRECIWRYINEFPELVGKYREALNCPVSKLKWVYLKFRIRRKLKRILSRG